MAVTAVVAVMINEETHGAIGITYNETLLYRMFKVQNRMLVQSVIAYKGTFLPICGDRLTSFGLPQHCAIDEGRSRITGHTDPRGLRATIDDNHLLLCHPPEIQRSK